MKINLALLFLLFCGNSFAQIASASLFKEMRSQNPAVITQRPAATLSMALRNDMVEKEQDVSGDASYDESTSDIDITNYAFFYGGKGGGLTSEVYGELASGTKDDKVVVGGSTTTVSTEADMMLLSANFGISDFLGLGVLQVTEDRDQTSTTGTSTYETTITAFNIGTQFSFGLDFGLFYQPATFTSEGSFEGSPFNRELDMPRVGFGVGKRGKNFHFEVGYVMNLDDMAEDQGGGAGAGANTVTYSPSKIFSAIEFKLGGLMLGVTSNYYRDGFFDFNNIMYYTMVLAANKEDRLENTFNFSLGGDKGHSFSGSVSYSTVESQELPPTLSAGTKYKTTSTIMGAQLSYTYNF